MKSAWERLSTRHLSMALETHALTAKVRPSELLYQEMGEMLDVLRERHPEVDKAVVRWYETGRGPQGDTDVVNVALKAVHAL